MQESKPKIDYNLCIGCGSCAAICPQKAVQFKDNKPEINYSLCVNCGICVDSCPAGAIVGCCKISDNLQK